MLLKNSVDSCCKLSYGGRSRQLRVGQICLGLTLWLSGPTGVSAGEWESQVKALQAGSSKQIHLSENAITSDQATELCKYSATLQNVLLDKGGLDDSSVGYLACLKQLTHLRVRSTTLESRLTDKAIAALADAQLENIRILNLPQAKVTAKGIRRMQEFPQLVQLRLGGRQINDAAVAEIAKLPNLRALHLIGPKLSSKALADLAQSPKLASFYLDDCQLNDDAWLKLFEAKPNLHVHIDQHHHDRDPNAHADGDES